MPTCGGVTVSLQSQYDALTIPEYSASSSRLNEDPEHSPEETYTSPTDKFKHSPVDGKFSRTRCIDVDIPILSASQFWICYSCSPFPLELRGPDDMRYMYFKLYVDEKCIASWGVGESESWAGKMMYTLSSAGSDFEGKKIIEKRGLFFPKVSVGSRSDGFEIRTFRAQARRREPPKYESSKELDVGKDGLK